jgi:hypothetical protein
MQGLPLVTRTKDFVTTGYSDVTDIGLALPLTRIPNKWSLQVTGLTAAGAVAAPTSWEVRVQRSLDGLAYDDDAGSMLVHVNGTNANGAVVSTDGNLRPCRWVRIHVVALVLGATATKIRVSLLGER